MRTKAPFTLPLRCARCQGEVTLQMTAKLLNPPNDRQWWACPYCQKRNDGTFPYKVVWATKGSGVGSKG
jgi:hypothetical protein